MRIPLPFPVAMRGVIDHCVLVSLRTPVAEVERLVPKGLRLITKAHPQGDARFAFWNVVLCHIDRMRPIGAPRSMGVSYHHVAHRLMVEADDDAPPGESATQGLYFLRSDADSNRVTLGGNLASDFRFRAARIERVQAAGEERWRIRSRDHMGDLDASFTPDPGPLADGSPFATAEEARSFLKYRPMGLAPGAKGARLRLAEVFRDEADWDERPIRVAAFRSAFLRSFGDGAATVELASRVAPIDYRWRLGRSIPVKTG